MRGGRTGPRKGWGEEGKKKKKKYKKIIGEAKNLHSEGIQSFEILKTCEKRKKVRRGGRGWLSEGKWLQPPHIVQKNRIFFFEIFMLGNFTLQTFLVHMEVN